MEPHKTEQIRQRAYEIWQEEGCPSGSELRHWLMATSELGGSSLSGTLSENLSVLGEGDETERPSTAADLSKNGKSARRGSVDTQAPAAVEITTGKEPARKKVRRTEGP